MRVFLVMVLLWEAVASASEFPEPFNSERDSGAGPMGAEEAAASFELPEGFEIRVFASEPEIQNPIAMAWDYRGRMWVAENYTYAEKGVRFEEGLRDRVVVLEDADWDGVAEKRTVFTDEVRILTSVEVGRGGVWLMCPPQLLFIPDEDEDLVPDGPAEVVLDGFEVAKNNHHNFANGLRWGPDGWLYGRCGHSCPGMLGVPGTPEEKRVPIDGGIWRFKPGTDRVEVLTHGTVNPWGFDWNAEGELFHINTVIGHLWHVIPGAHYEESFGASRNPLVFDRIGQHADHFHYDTGESWTKSRDGAANDFGGGHSHIGMCIYQDDQFPASWQGKLLTWNQHGRRLNVERLERSGSGYVGRHEEDRFLVGDSWFRGIDVRVGPDGSLFALDWSDTGECHDHTGVHRTSGRIYRISYGEPEPPRFPTVMKEDGGGIFTAPMSEGGVDEAGVWRYRRVLEAGDTFNWDHAGCLTRLQDTSLAASQRLRAMWLINRVDDGWTRAWVSPSDFLDDPDEHLRVWAIRLATDSWPIDTLHGPMESRLPVGDPELEAKFVEMAASDESGLVRLALASTLQRLPVDSRPALAKALAARDGDAGDHNLPKMVWYGLMPVVEENPGAVVEVISGSVWPELIRWGSRAMAGSSEEVEQLVALAVDSEAHRVPVFAGLLEGYRGWRKASKPGNWDMAVEQLGDLPEVRELGVLFGDGRALDEIREIATDSEADTKSREVALGVLIEARPDYLKEVCLSLLASRELNVIAAKGLAGFDDTEVGKRLARELGRRNWSGEKNVLIDGLSSRPEWALLLLDKVGVEGGISRDEITPFHARQIAQLGDSAVSDRLREVWGEVRTSDAAKLKRMAEIKAAMTTEVLAAGDLERGRVLYGAVCASCHQLYGKGGKLGPDLTGSGRGEIDYLLESVVDPSAVVSAEFQASTVVTKGGRSLSGVVVEENERSLTLRQLSDELVVNKDDIVIREVSEQSVMPEGLFDVVGEEGLRDLLVYLMHFK